MKLISFLLWLIRKVFWFIQIPESDDRCELEKHIESLKEAIRGVKLQLAKSIQQEQLLSARIAEAELMAEQCTRQAIDFLQKGREDAARTALRQKKTHLQNVALLRPEIEEQRKNIKVLTESIEILQNRLEQAKTQLELQNGRQRRADSQFIVSKILQDTNRSIELSESPLAIPQRADHRVVLANATLDSERAQLSESLCLTSLEEAVDAELVSLKDELKQGKSISASGPVDRENKVDDPSALGKEQDNK